MVYYYKRHSLNLKNVNSSSFFFNEAQNLFISRKVKSR